MDDEQGVFAFRIQHWLDVEEDLLTDDSPVWLATVSIRKPAGHGSIGVSLRSTSVIAIANLLITEQLVECLSPRR